MTIGQRIAQQRKKLGLSQEALGEKLGISRQAISKWEADASVPEIDKLIVLSKLFGVSVGWLLGVESQPSSDDTVPLEEAPEKKPSFWQELHQRLRERPWFGKLLRWVTPRRFGIVLLILTQLYLCLWVVRSHNMAVNASIEAAIAKSAAESAQRELSSLRNSLTTQEETGTPSGALLSGYSFAFDLAADSLKATATFSAVPYSWQEGVKGYLCLSGKGIQSLEIPCQWDGAFLNCAAVMDLSESTQLCFAIEYGDGSRQLQLLPVPELESGDYVQPPEVSGTVGSIKYDPKAKALLLKELDVNFQRSHSYTDTAVTWKTQAILLLADGEEITRLVHFDANAHPRDSSFTDGGGGFYTREKLLPNVVLTEGQQMELVLYADLSNGLSAQEILGTWTAGENGTLSPA